MRLLILGLLLFSGNIVNGQTSLQQINLQYGQYNVGFEHYQLQDVSRTYRMVNEYNTEVVARPISVSIWYPSKENATDKNPLKILNYFEVLKQEEEWPHLPNEHLLNWFYYPNTPDNNNHLVETTKAYKSLNPADKKFPVVVYTPSYQASSVENFGLCEYLASHGYVVLASPSIGTVNRWFSNNNAKEMETQSRDVEFLLQHLLTLSYTDKNRVALAGFSFGGLSNTITQMRNDNIKAVVSLDGTERYQYPLLQQSPFFANEQLDVPYIHMAQKDIPENVLQQDKLDKGINTRFTLYDSITNSKAYKIKFHNLTHSHFSTMGVLFQPRDPRQDKSDTKIMESYAKLCKTTLHFLNAYLMDDKKVLNHLKAIDNDLMSFQSKDPETEAFGFEEFHTLMKRAKYNNLYTLYTTTKKEHTDLSVPEGALNTLGLKLTFNPGYGQQGIAVLQFATQLYPQSSNLYDSLAEAYLYLGDKKNARINFKKSLELNAANQNAINRLKQL